MRISKSTAIPDLPLSDLLSQVVVDTLCPCAFSAIYPRLFSHSAAQAPCADDDPLDQHALKSANGREVFEHRVSEGLVILSAFRGHDDGFGGEPVLERVHFGAFAPFVGFGTGAPQCVLAVRFRVFGCCHLSPQREVALSAYLVIIVIDAKRWAHPKC